MTTSSTDLITADLDLPRTTAAAWSARWPSASPRPAG